MKNETLVVSITCGYGNQASIKVMRADGKKIETFIMEREYVTKLLEKMIEEKGYSLSLTPRQQYQRITINQ